MNPRHCSEWRLPIGLGKSFRTNHPTTQTRCFLEVFRAAIFQKREHRTANIELPTSKFRKAAIWGGFLSNEASPQTGERNKEQGEGRREKETKFGADFQIRIEPQITQRARMIYTGKRREKGEPLPRNSSCSMFTVRCSMFVLRGFASHFRLAR
jgi:hypothetical protein